MCFSEAGVRRFVCDESTGGGLAVPEFVRGQSDLIHHAHWPKRPLVAGTYVFSPS